MDAAEDDHLGLDCGRLLAQFQGIADEIGRVLDLAQLIVVGDDDRVPLFFEAGDRRGHVSH